MKRRRFLQIAAAASLVGTRTQANTWQGRAFGADVSIQVPGPAPMAEVLAEIAAIEACFSLHRDSEVTLLNATGRAPGSAHLRAALKVAQQVHQATQGAFDPTVQSLWTALAEAGDVPKARTKIGLEHVEIGPEITLGYGQSLTFNGIAQGYAADRVAQILARHGMGDCLIDMGEYCALDGQFRLGIEDPDAGLVGRWTLDGRGGQRALATSSPGALALPGGSHILGPRGQRPVWSTVTVEAESAALADAASTAFVLLEKAALKQAARSLRTGPVTVVDFEGNLQVI